MAIDEMVFLWHRIKRNGFRQPADMVSLKTKIRLFKSVFGKYPKQYMIFLKWKAKMPYFEGKRGLPTYENNI